MDKCDYCKSLNTVDPVRLVYEGKFWQVALASNQEYLGKCFVTLRRHTERLSDLSNDEIVEFLNLVKKYEAAVTKAFKPTHFNWSCLMNMSAGTDQIFHVHWHGVPRYKDKRRIEDHDFVDPRWPKSIRNIRENIPPPDVLNTITKRIKSGF